MINTRRDWPLSRPNLAVQLRGWYSRYRLMIDTVVVQLRAVPHSQTSVGRGTDVYCTVVIDYYRAVPIRTGFPTGLTVQYSPVHCPDVR